jgi:hypothetical protein
MTHSWLYKVIMFLLGVYVRIDSLLHTTEGGVLSIAVMLLLCAAWL